jgi:hypothetical protein
MDYEAEERADRAKLEGKTIKTAEPVEDKHIRLYFTDGTQCLLYGLGYDGLWDEVNIQWEGEGPT